MSTLGEVTDILRRHQQTLIDRVHNLHEYIAEFVEDDEEYKECCRKSEYLNKQINKFTDVISDNLNKLGV